MEFSSVYQDLATDLKIPLLLPGLFSAHESVNGFRMCKKKSTVKKEDSAGAKLGSSTTKRSSTVKKAMNEVVGWWLRFHNRLQRRSYCN